MHNTVKNNDAAERQKRYAREYYHRLKNERPEQYRALLRKLKIQNREKKYGKYAVYTPSEA